MSQNPLPGWAEQAAALAGAGGVSVIALKLIERVFARDALSATDRASISSELRQDIRDLKADVEKMEARLDLARRENVDLVRLNTRLQSENEALRERYHALLNTLQILVHRDETYRRTLGLPPDDLPIPSIVYQRLPGPTEQPGRQPPPAEEPPA